MITNFPARQRVVIFGTTDFAQVAHAYLSRIDAYEVAGFTAHARHIASPTLLGCDVVPFEHVEQRFPPAEFAMLVAIGYSRMNKGRADVYQACKARGYRLIKYVDPGASLVGDVSLGDNCFVFEGNVIQPFVTIGSNVVLWSGNHVGHHSTIGDNCFVASHAVICGRVTIGPNCFIGANATIRDGITIAPNCLIGAGTTILRDTKEGEVYRVEGTQPSSHPSHRWRV